MKANECVLCECRADSLRGAECHGVLENVDALTVASKFPTLKPTLLYSNTQPYRLFSDPKMRDLE